MQQQPPIAIALPNNKKRTYTLTFLLATLAALLLALALAPATTVTTPLSTFFTMSPAPAENVTPAAAQATTSSTAKPLTATELTALSTEWHALRSQKGHFSGGDHSRDVDGHGGRKHVVMQTLADHFCPKDKSHLHHAIEILDTMGPPDEIVPKIGASNVGPLQAAGAGAIVEGMPGPVLGGGDGVSDKGVGSGKPYFICYYWRGRHDYLWFEVDETPDENIHGYGWYAAGE
ncbi:hypothetical protein HDU89_004977 [Geranomyces variabilis]|nr:hypothetical protein HDU89_004977 [Geranomyces variabilis]